MTDHAVAFARPPLAIREIGSLEEMKAIERLQSEVWGYSELDVVPASELLVAREVGGCLVGAYDGGRLAGFVFGMLGRDDGELTMHSNMLAVATGYRGRNLGYSLKLAQRAAVLARGIRQITWTFDPMLSLNAHLNFGKLGVIARKYKINFFGGTTSSVVDQAGTDRLWVTWLLDSSRVAARLDSSPPKFDVDGAPRAVKCATDLTPCMADYEAALQAERFLIEIPCGWNSMLENQRWSMSWRTATRSAFTRALQSGYTVREFLWFGSAGPSAGCYLLARDHVSGDGSQPASERIAASSVDSDYKTELQNSVSERRKP